MFVKEQMHKFPDSTGCAVSYCEIAQPYPQLSYKTSILRRVFSIDYIQLKYVTNLQGYECLFTLSLYEKSLVWSN